MSGVWIIDRLRFGFLQPIFALVMLFSAGVHAQASQLKLLAFGDSLFAGYLLPQDAAFPLRLEAALREKGFDVQLINAAVSGDTAEAGLRRIDWALDEHPDVLLLELGANDMLRGHDPARIYLSLAAIIEKAQQQHIAIALFGMMADPALGDAYAQSFNAIYPRLAAFYHLPLYPFFLDGVATEPQLKLSDGMHPNAGGIDVLVAHVLPFMTDFLMSIKNNQVHSAH
jgi:acyl-CoA thioesterase-1